MAFTIHGTNGLTFPDSSSQTTRAVNRSGDTMTGSLGITGGNILLTGSGAVTSPSMYINKSVDAEAQIGIVDTTRNNSLYMYNAYTGGNTYVGLYQGGTNQAHLINRDITNARNNYPQAVIDPKYDSGWFTTTNGQGYTLTHNLGRRPKLCSLMVTEVSGNQNDTATVWWVASVAIRDGDYGASTPRVGQTLQVSSTSIVLYTAYDKIIHPDPRHNYWGGATVTTAYYRVFAS